MSDSVSVPVGRIVPVDAGLLERLRSYAQWVVEYSDCSAQIHGALDDKLTVQALLAAVPVEPEKVEPVEKRQPCPDGFHWIGPSFAHCDQCGFPAWEHEGDHKPLSPFGDAFEVVPYTDEQKATMRRKWAADV